MSNTSTQVQQRDAFSAAQFLDDIHAQVLAQARRQRAAAETRCARLMHAIDALEERLERVEND